MWGRELGKTCLFQWSQYQLWPADPGNAYSIMGTSGWWGLRDCEARVKWAVVHVYVYPFWVVAAGAGYVSSFPAVEKEVVNWALYFTLTWTSTWGKIWEWCSAVCDMLLGVLFVRSYDMMGINISSSLYLCLVAGNTVLHGRTFRKSKHLQTSHIRKSAQWETQQPHWNEREVDLFCFIWFC